MRQISRLGNREAQALMELGSTAVRPAVARFLVAALLLIIAAPPAIDLAVAGRVPGAEALRQVPELGSILAERGILAANRALIADLQAFESRLESETELTRTLLPPVQWLQTRLLGAGNEQVYPGRDGWLFYRPDVEYATGRGFLDPAVLRGRSRSGEAWEAPPRPDPVPAIAALARDLRARGIDLLVVPVPVKPVIHPERLSARYAAERRSRRPGATSGPVQNPSFAAFVERLGREGIAVLDLAPPLAAAAATGEQYLRQDTHWRPEAVAAAAGLIAERARPLLAGGAAGDGKTGEEALGAGSGTGGGEAGGGGTGGSGTNGGEAGGGVRYRRVSVRVTGTGDTAALLKLPRGRHLAPPQEVVAQRVVAADGSPWRPDPAAEVLLLGDSFTNVYSVPELGWGEGAGLAEQIAFGLQRPIDRIAVNAGGSWTARQRLAAELRRGSDRLAGKRLVVYQFAVRELTSGDWRTIALPPPASLAPPAALPDTALPGDPAPLPGARPDDTPPGAGPGTAAPGRTHPDAAPPAPIARFAGGRIVSLPAPPDPATTPYRDCLIGIQLADLRDSRGRAVPGEAVVYTWGMRDRRLTAAARLQSGRRVRGAFVPWPKVAARYEALQRLEPPTQEALLLEAYWAEELAW